MSMAQLREAILYIANKSTADPKLGKTKLNKLLWHADIEAYLWLGRTITDEEYQKLPQGPAPRIMATVLDRMQREDLIDIRPQNRLRRILAKLQPKAGIFSYEEVVILNRIIERYWETSGTELSRESHNHLGWKATRLGETVPFETSFIVSRPLTTRERKRALDLSRSRMHLQFHGA